MKAIVIEWNGTETPKELVGMPPGRYRIELLEDFFPLTPEEEDGIIEALDSLDAGEGIPYEQVLRELQMDA